MGQCQSVNPAASQAFGRRSRIHGLKFQCARKRGGHKDFAIMPNGFGAPVRFVQPDFKSLHPTVTATREHGDDIFDPRGCEARGRAGVGQSLILGRRG